MTDVSKDALHDNIALMTTDPTAWRHGFAELDEAKSVGQKRKAHASIRAGAVAFQQSKMFKVSERTEDDFVMPEEELIMHREARGDDVATAKKKFHALHLEQGSGEDSTDVERVSIPKPIRVKRRRGGKETATGVTQENSISDEWYQQRKKGIDGSDGSDMEPLAAILPVAPLASSYDGESDVAMRCPPTLPRSSTSEQLMARTQGGSSRRSAASSGAGNADAAGRKARKKKKCDDATPEPTLKLSAVAAPAVPDVDGMTGNDFLTHKSAIKIAIQQFVKIVGNKTSGMLGELTAALQTLFRRSGDVDDLDGNHEEYCRLMQESVAGAEELLANFHKVKKTDLAATKASFEAIKAKLDEEDVAIQDYTQCVKRKSGVAKTDRKKETQTDYWRWRHCYEQLITGQFPPSRYIL